MTIIGSCNSCLLEVDTADKYINCPDCNRIYHEKCWSKNNSKCSEYGCKGKKEIVASEPDSSTVNQNQTGNLNNNSDIPINNQDNFRRVANSPQNKLVIGLLIVIVLLFIFIAINFSKNSPTQLVQNNPVIPTPSSVLQATSQVNPSFQESTDAYSSNIPEIISTPESNTTDNVETENIEIKNLIEKSRRIKNEGFLKLDSSQFESVFIDKALKDYTGGINWCKENNAYRQTVTHSLNINDISRKDGIYEVVAGVDEKSNYYQNGEFKTKDSYDKFYSVRYKIVKTYDGVFKISDAQVVK